MTFLKEVLNNLKKAQRPLNETRYIHKAANEVAQNYVQEIRKMATEDYNNLSDDEKEDIGSVKDYIKAMTLEHGWLQQEIEEFANDFEQIVKRYFK